MATTTKRITIDTFTIGEQEKLDSSKGNGYMSINRKTHKDIITCISSQRQREILYYFISCAKGWDIPTEKVLDETGIKGKENYLRERRVLIEKGYLLIDGKTLTVNYEKIHKDAEAIREKK